MRAGLLDELVSLLATENGGAVHALSALEAIATDDPDTELDNGHALETCKAGAVLPTVRLLASTNEQLQVGAAGLAAVLAENPECQTQLLKAGAVKSLINLGALRCSLSLTRQHPPQPATSSARRACSVVAGTYGNDGAKLRCVAALDLLALNNPAALEAISAAGGKQLLKGLQRFGGDMMRVSEFS